MALLGSSRTTILILLGLAILVVLVLTAREINKAVHPRSKALRKRKRRTF
jgi:hypothetical protein